MVQFFNFVEGANPGVGPFLVSPQGAIELLGCSPGRVVGSLLKDVGYENVGSQINSGQPITGGIHYQPVGSDNRDVVTTNDSTGADTELYTKTDAGSWTEITAAQSAWANKADVEVSILQYLDQLFFAGYSEADGFLPIANLDDTTFSTSNNVTNMPAGKYLSLFQNRVFVSNVLYSGDRYPQRAYFSSLPAAGALTWNPTVDFIPINSSEEIVATHATFGNLYLWTDNEMHKYDGQTSRKLWDIGCANHRVVKEVKFGLMWADDDGIYLSHQGSMPRNVGGAFIQFLKNSNANNWTAEVVDEEYHLYIGDVTVDSVAYSNMVLIYDNKIDRLWARELGSPMKIAYRKKTSSGQHRLYFGDEDGNVWNRGKWTDSVLITEDEYTGTKGSGKPINSEFTLPPLKIDSYKSRASIEEIIAFAENAGGLKMYIRVLDPDKRNFTPWKTIGTLTDFRTILNSTNAPKGAMVQVRGAEYGIDEPWLFYGYEPILMQEGENH